MGGANYIKKSNRLVGREQEQLAVEYLRKNGCKIVERNYQIASGELDIIAWDGNYLLFVEVKYRSSDVAGYAAEAVGYRKQERIYHTAQHYMRKNHILPDFPCRFDVIAIEQNGKIDWIQNAFGGM